MNRVAARPAGAVLLASVTSLVLPSNGQAQGIDQEEIVVTARRRPEALLDVPIAVSVMTEQTIEQAGIRQVVDYAQLVPNMSFDNALNLGNNFLTIRGMTQVQYGPPPVAIVVDGVLQMSPYQFNVDGMDLDQIEVLKGPQGAIYGRNAIGGAINITTHRPTQAYEGGVSAGYATGEEFTAKARVSGPIVDDRLFFSAALSTTDREGGQIENQTTDRPTDHYKDKSAKARLLFTPTDNLEFDLSYRYADTDGPDPTYTLNPVAVGTDENDTSFPPISNTIGSNPRELNEAALRASLSTALGTASLSLGFVDVNEELYSDFDFLPFDLLNVRQSYDNQGFSQELRFTSNEDERFRWLIGAYHVVLDSDVETIAYDGVDGFTPVANDVAQQLFDANRTENYAFFAQAAYDVSPALELAVAVRYDHDDYEQTTTVIQPPFGDFPADVSFDEVQPKFTARYSITDDVNVYASWGRGFRNGGFNSILASSRIYRPEVAETYELGLKARFFSDRLDLDIAGFSTDLSDAQFVFLNSATFTNETANIDQVDLLGFEASLSFHATDALALAAAVGVTDTEIGTYTPDPTANGNTGPKAPGYTFNFSATYDWNFTAALAGVLRVDYQRLGEMYWDILNNFERDPLDTLNARLTISMEPTGVYAALWGRNLLDETLPTDYIPYEQTGHPTGLDGFQRNRGALYGVEVGYRF
jgi:iron complex outermembrane receptor protein